MATMSKLFICVGTFLNAWLAVFQLYNGQSRPGFVFLIFLCELRDSAVFTLLLSRKAK
jgi:hypothetical protein